ncbi:hypothetical protein [Defluviimonas salinarum]|uniref:Uncharacterized protein n=1 Tax=Defluviimonas salinarum TaxID=2992147 RepID=A0ABT3J4D9_9RHOB|nr:hypothetical protein [Defluviimonas salinarum]MCW3782555.1 hypothetical protein [Defluviimonas salinarum]
MKNIEASINENGADDVMNFKGGIFRKRGRDVSDTEGSGLPTIDEALFIPLFLGDSCHLGRVTFRKRGTVLSQANLHQIPAGRYHIHVFDTFREACAAAAVLESIGFMGGMEKVQVNTGEGLLLVNPSFSAADMVGAPISNPTKSLRFDGNGGAVSVDILDERSKHTDGDGLLCAGSREIVCSLSYGRRKILVALHQLEQTGSDSLRRGQVMARILKDEMLCPSVIRSFQREIERIPGALVSLASISVENVLDQFDDLTEGLDNEISPPDIKVLHRMIHARSKDSAGLGRRLARDIAWTANVENLSIPV